jgi:hypothetical protein
MSSTFASLSRVRRATASLGLALATSALAAPPAWKLAPSYALKQGYDSNVYLQDHAAFAGSSPAKRSSAFSTVAAGISAEQQWSERFGLTAAYAVDHTQFWSASEENHTLHRLSLALTGRAPNTTWSFQSFLLRTDGSSDGPIYTGPGGAPALGGAPVRDRRDSLVTNAVFKLTHTLGKWQIRPSATFNYQDFDTTHRRVTGCANYIDRSDLFVGLDVAREIRPKTFVVLGYRFGDQQQYKLYNADSPYDSRIDRFLVGIEGAPLPWLQLSLLGGPEIRHYDDAIPATFDRDERPLWVDATATFKLSPRQTLALVFRRSTLPSASSLGIYDSSTWDLTWRNRLTDRYTAAAGVKLARGDWMAPASREDRIVTPSLSLTCAFAQRRQLEIAWSFDDAMSRLPATTGREYRRHLVLLCYKQVL